MACFSNKIQQRAHTHKKKKIPKNPDAHVDAVHKKETKRKRDLGNLIDNGIKDVERKKRDLVCIGQNPDEHPYGYGDMTTGSQSFR